MSEAAVNGTLRLGSRGGLHLLVGDEHYRVGADDLKPLLFHGHVVPVTGLVAEEMEDGSVVTETAIVGHAAMNVFERSVKVFTVAGHFIVPLVSVQRVVRGEAASAPLFPLIPEGCP
ncbi:hypothetical protein E2N92_04015 [Methanofollis formosanus]|uniref:Uncharacterized protein n=1 Tax=Methanofollis formosanus TaxID=299308 RepID=A0A8G1EG82_9EURY|nr:hypothetical protein [Methanofollis formosanus]QYZ78647.1 hypothetical protein E2N92_04015 [Methanofollis formosanus]